MKIKKLLISFLSILLCLILFGCKEKKVITVNFDSDGGSFVSAVVLEGEGKVNRPTDPTKDGFTFVEWQLDGKAFDFTSTIDKDITLKAVYTPKSSGESGNNNPNPEVKKRTVSVKVGDKSYIITVKEGEDLVIETPTSSDGSKFIGWKIDGTIKDLSEAKDGSIIEAVFDTNKPCTKLKSDYKTYYCFEGVKPWELFGITVTPEDTTDTLEYSVEDETICTIDSKGFVTPGKIGATKIHIKCGEQEIVVNFETRKREVEATAMELGKYQVNLETGDTYKITYKLTPEDASADNITFTASNDKVASVDSKGNVTAKSGGSCNITIKVNDKVSEVINICVTDYYLILFMNDNVKVKAGSGEKVAYKVYLNQCKDNKQQSWDITNNVDFKTAYTSALDIDGSGNVYAKGAVYESVNIPFHFEYVDGDGTVYKTEERHIYVEK